MKTLTVKNPYAYLVCSGIKPIENRTWPTKFRGKVLIHASAKPVNMRVPSAVFLSTQWNALSFDQRVLVRSNTLTNSAIIGSVEIVDCVVNHDSIWAEKTAMAYLGKLTIECQKPVYNWVLANPVLFPEPIPAKGKLSFWDYPNILAEPEEKYGDLFCHCQLPVKESNQVSGFIDHYRCNYCGGRWYK